MSLSHEAFARASEESGGLSERLIRLFGYDHDAISDHYDCTTLYNEEINIRTSDEEILAIRDRFLLWKESIQAFFAENGAVLDDRKFRKLLSKNRFGGCMYFLKIPVDIDGGVDKYRDAILEFLKKETV